MTQSDTSSHRFLLVPVNALPSQSISYSELPSFSLCSSTQNMTFMQMHHAPNSPMQPFYFKTPGGPYIQLMQCPQVLIPSSNSPANTTIDISQFVPAKPMSQIGSHSKETESNNSSNSFSQYYERAPTANFAKFNSKLNTSSLKSIDANLPPDGQPSFLQSAHSSFHKTNYFGSQTCLLSKVQSKQDISFNCQTEFKELLNTSMSV